MYFLATAKSSRFQSHTGLEYKLIKKHAKTIYLRDEETKEDCLAQGLQAKSFGNVMIDFLDVTVLKSPEHHCIGLMPGSRHEAYQNLNQFLEIVIHMSKQKKDLSFVFARSASFDLNEYKKNLPKRWIYQSKEKQFFDSETGVVVTVMSDFNSFLSQSHACIGLAGTANEQAVYANRPVFTFPGAGPQSSLKRFQEQSLLLGDLLQVIDTQEPIKIAELILSELAHIPLDYPILKHRKSASEQIMNDILRSEC